MTTELLKANELHKVDPVFGQVSFDGHEQVVFCNDKDTGLKAIIGIHNTVLGPASLRDLMPAVNCNSGGSVITAPCCSI